MLATSFEEGHDLPKDDQADNGQDVEYTFEGFNIDFSKKVLLTPAAKIVDKQARLQVQH